MTCECCTKETPDRVRFRMPDTGELLWICRDCAADLIPERDKDREP